MTRKEQIYNEADKYAKHAQVSLKDFISTAFANGAAWADANPRWNDCKETMPKDGDNVLIWFREYPGGEPLMSTGEYNYYFKEWIIGSLIDSSKCEVLAWMKLPTYDKI